jgi:hypothetical protein
MRQWLNFNYTKYYLRILYGTMWNYDSNLNA